MKTINDYNKPPAEKVKILFIVRGLPGSGKSTIAKQLSYNHFEADQYFERDGEYNFIPSEIGNAHQWCRHQVRNAMLN
jgi:shikimate kinase